MIMDEVSSRLSYGIICITAQLLLSSVISGHSWCPAPPNGNSNVKFLQKNNRFWKFEEKTKSWVEISLPFDLMSCINGSCTKVGSIESMDKKLNQVPLPRHQENKKIDRDKIAEESNELVLPLRKRISLTRMSEASVWVTGQSGSIYERFWNGLKWVIAPHVLPSSAGQAVSVFIFNPTILSLSEAGILYQLQLNENSQPIWTEFMLLFKPSERTAESEPDPSVRIKSGIVSQDGEKLYFATTDGSLLEIIEIQPLRWENHGRPPGGDVSAIADTGSIKEGVVFTLSSAGDLYEFDKKSKPSWKKHIWSEALMEEVSLAPSTGCTLHGLLGVHSRSLFLLSKDGSLIERRLHKRKWKWTVHGAPEGHYLSAITPTQQNDIEEKILSLFLTTTAGFVFEYQLPKKSGTSEGIQKQVLWVNHMHPQHAKVARGVQGVQLQAGRILFPLDDGRLGELHFAGIGGESSGPNHQISPRRKTSNRYEWSVLDAPETEGWNADYCTEEHGPLNCMKGMKDEPNDSSSTSPARRTALEQQSYISLPNHESGGRESSNFLTKSININFRMRVMYLNRSFFFITESGITFEYLYADSVWLWLRHEQSTTMKGAVGSYNGSLFAVDAHGSLLIRERRGNELSWINCTAIKKGRQVSTGSPWDGILRKDWKVTAEDALFFVSKNGRLLQFTVALRKFKWKDCRSPPDTTIAFIVDQEFFRVNIIFVIGRNGRLYQYNKITELWHQHYQSPHLVLSRAPGTAMRPSPLSLTGSLFMISKSGGLVEYHWNAQGGWEWVEHGTPYRDIRLVGAPGPCLDGNQLFVIGSDGHVYQRHLEQRAWRWTSHGHPCIETVSLDAQRRIKQGQRCNLEDYAAKTGKNAYYPNAFSKNCNEKVAPTRPIPFSEDSLIFELQDGRLAELRRADGEGGWDWARIIGTPTSLCFTAYWTAVAA